MAKITDANYWNSRYKDQETGWDIGYVSTPIKEYIDQLNAKDLKILIPGAGNSYEAEYLYNQGFTDVTVIDLAEIPLNNIKKRIPSFPEERLIQDDFFNHIGSYDLIIEQTFFCAIDPSLREKYISKTHELLAENGKLVGLLFEIPFNPEHPPYGGNREEYKELFNENFDFLTFDTAYNSIEPRQNKEVFINFKKK